MVEWQWYQDWNTMRLFLHLLIKANHKTWYWLWNKIERWQLITWREILSKELKLTPQQIRTSLNKLKSTSEITIKTTNKYSLIEITNYNKYQQDNQQTNQQVTNKQPTDNQQVTTNNNDNNKKNDKKNKYGEYKNVLLTLAQKNKLIEDYWEDLFNKYIQILDEWIQLKWYKYKDHNLAMRKWIKKDNEKHNTQTVSNEYEKEKAKRLARYNLIPN